MEEITGIVDRITFQSEDSGFTVARLSEAYKKTPTPIVGVMMGLQEGESICCKGYWKEDKRFGKQFEVKEYQLHVPATVNAIERYLASGLIKGLGRVFAKRIVKKFGKETLEVLDKNPEKLLDIPGLGKNKLQQVTESWRAQRQVREVMIFLQKYGVSPTYAQKIYKTYRDDSIRKVKSNPYRLANDIFGIGFKKADEVARNMGLTLEAPQRIEAGIVYALEQLAQQGHVCYPVDQFLQAAARLLAIDPDLINQLLGELLRRKHIVVEPLELDGQMKAFIWKTNLYRQEQGIVEELQRLGLHGKEIAVRYPEKAMNWAAEKLSIQLADAQAEAVLKSLSEKVHIITGGPGTGKSTITKVILRIMRKHSNKIVLAAPTGRASKRLSNITGMDATTIHSLLSVDFQMGGFRHNKDNPLDGDVFIVDEASMMDTQLMYSLLQAIPDKGQLLLIGDVDQLPSVGPGNVLRDLLESEQLPATRLREIFRQAAHSKITINAHKINQGFFPDIDIEADSDFFFIRANQPAKIIDWVRDLVNGRLSKKYNLDPVKDIQVLSPMRRGNLGTHVLNTALQNALNPRDKKEGLKRGEQVFLVDDKIMQIRNNYDKGVFNGDVGRIQSIDHDERFLVAKIGPKLVDYKFSELHELELAYAVSVHKYQGSECPCIVMPLHESHYKLLYRNLIYTGITRGKKLVVLVGSPKALQMAIANEEVKGRFTGLKEALQKEQQKEAKGFPPIQIIPPLGSDET